jgi:hypothetical protein
VNRLDFDGPRRRTEFGEHAIQPAARLVRQRGLARTAYGLDTLCGAYRMTREMTQDVQHIVATAVVGITIPFD